MRDVKSAMPDATSLNQTMSSDSDNSEIGEVVEDARASDVVGELMREMGLEDLRSSIERLPERRRYVLVRRYGLDDHGTTTLERLGKELGLPARGSSNSRVKRSISSERVERPDSSTTSLREWSLPPSLRGS